MAKKEKGDHKKDSKKIPTDSNGKELVQKNEEESKKDINPDDPIDAEVLENLPPEMRREVKEFLFQKISGPMPNPIMSKVNGEHIDKMLDIAKESDKYDFDDNQSSKLYNLIYVVLGILFFIFLVIYLAKENPDLFVEILKIVVLIGGGFGGGYGYKSYLNRKND